MKTITTISIFLSILFVSQNIFAVTHYVSPSGGNVTLKTIPSGWVQWRSQVGGNDHWYKAVATSNIIWSSASEQAQALGGYLATVTSSSEQDFIISTFPDAVSGGYWLGGFQPPGTPEPADGWTWVTGEVWSYQNWNPGQPGNVWGGGGGVEEDYLHIYWAVYDSNGRWNDYPGSTTWAQEIIGGFVVERNYSFNDIAITTFPITVANNIGTYTIAGTSSNIIGSMWVSNAANNEVHLFSASTSWTAPAVNLEIGTNTIYVFGKNAADEIASDSVDIIRLSNFSLTNGLVAYYPFNGNANDESGNGNHGIEEGNAYEAGVIGLSSRFYGGTSSHIRITQDWISSSDNEITITAWVKFRESKEGWILSQRLNNKRGDFGLHQSTDGKLALYFFPGPDRPVWYKKCTMELPIGRWFFVATVYNANTKQVTFYIDQSSESIAMAAGEATSYKNAIGGVSTVAFNQYDTDGNIDELRIYNRALSSAEVWELYDGEPSDDEINITTAPKTVANSVTSYAIVGTSSNIVGSMWVSNAANNEVHYFPAAASWASPVVNLEIGTNTIYAFGKNSSDEIASDSVDIVRNPFLSPDFMATPVTSIVGETVHFTDMTTGNPIEWEWDFNGDGIVDSIEQNPDFIYKDSGVYTVNLRVGDGTGLHPMMLWDDYILVKEPNKANISVVLIHGKPSSVVGWISSTLYWKKFKDMLVEKGYKESNIYPISVSEINSWEGEDSSWRLLYEIDSLNIPSTNRVVFVAHGVGGLHLRNFLALRRSWIAANLDIAVCITLSTLHKGDNRVAGGSSLWKSPRKVLSPSRFCTFQVSKEMQFWKDKHGWNELHQNSWNKRWLSIAAGQRISEDGYGESVFAGSSAKKRYLNNNNWNVNYTFVKVGGPSYAPAIDTYTAAGLDDQMLIESQTVADVVDSYIMGSLTVAASMPQESSCHSKLKTTKTAEPPEAEERVIINKQIVSNGSETFYLDEVGELQISIMDTNLPNIILVHNDTQTNTLEFLDVLDNAYHFRLPLALQGKYSLFYELNVETSGVFVVCYDGISPTFYSDSAQYAVGNNLQLQLTTNGITSATADVFLYSLKTNLSFAGSLEITNGVSTLLDITITEDMLPYCSLEAQIEGLTSDNLQFTRWLPLYIHTFDRTITFADGSISNEITGNTDGSGSNLTFNIPVTAFSTGAFSISGVLQLTNGTELIRSDNPLTVVTTGTQTVQLHFSDSSLAMLEESPPYNLSNVTLSDENEYWFISDQTNGILLTVTNNPFSYIPVILTPALTVNSGSFDVDSERISALFDAYSPYVTGKLDVTVLDVGSAPKLTEQFDISGNKMINWSNSSVSLPDGQYFISATLSNQYDVISKLLSQPITVHRPNVQIISTTNYYNDIEMLHEVHLKGSSYDYVGIDYVTAKINTTNITLLSGTTNWAYNFYTEGFSGDVVNVTITAKDLTGHKASDSCQIILGEIPEPYYLLFIIYQLLFINYWRRK